MTVTISDLIDQAKLLELGCYTCRLHLYIDPAVLHLPGATAVPAAADHIKCPQCKAVNREPGYPIWTRPDARPPKMGAG